MSTLISYIEEAGLDKELIINGVKTRLYLIADKGYDSSPFISKIF